MRHSMKSLYLSNYINKISVSYTLKKQKNMFPLLTWPMPISYGNRLPVKFLSRQKRKNREFRPVFSFSTPYGFGRQTASFLVAQQKSEPSGLERCAHFFPLEVLRGTGLLRFHQRERNIFTIIKNLYMEWAQRPSAPASPLSLKPRLQAVGLMPGGNYFASSFPAFRVTDSLVFLSPPKAPLLTYSSQPL